MLNKKRLSLLLALLAVIAVVVMTFGSTSLSAISAEGQWMPTGDDSGCKGNAICQEWCLTSSGPTGILCCMPQSKTGSTNFNDCSQFRN